MAVREVRLGVDYGTSTSKLIFRDPLAPGKEKAYAVIRRGSVRIPSSLALKGSDLIWGCSPDTDPDLRPNCWYHSIKMRAAGEAKNDYTRFCHGPLPPLADGVSAKHLAALTVWFLLSEGERAICGYLCLSPSQLAINFTLGIPMSFYEDTCLRERFLEIAWLARKAFDKEGALGETHFSLADVRKAIKLFDSVERPVDVCRDDLRNWIRPESEAAMCLAVRSPDVSEGAYAEVDVGAGTTHATIFSILPDFRERRWVKDKLAFFGARSVPVGMDAVDEALARRQGIPHDNCLELRGEERRAIAKVGLGPLALVREQIRDVYVRAWRQAAPRLNRAELESFKNHQVFVVGGGSLVPELSEVLCKHPDGYERPLRLRSLSRPSDFFRADNKEISLDEIPFLAVAYGLTFNSIETPETFTPQDFGPAFRPRREFIPFEDR